MVGAVSTQTGEPASPRYRDLPPAPRGGRSAAGLWGALDSVGTVNLQTPQRVVIGAREIRTGKVFPLNAPLDAFDGASAHRPPSTRHVLHRPGYFDDVLDAFALQGSSHWDSLGHVGYDEDVFYNDADEAAVATGGRNTIEHWARRGIVGRAVLLDMQRTLADAGRGYHPWSATAFSVEDLESARKAAHVDIRPGDSILLHTGFASEFARRGSDCGLVSPGIEHSEEMVRYLWDMGVAAICSDTYSVEVWPPDWSPDAFPYGQLHAVLIGQLGFALGELWWLDDLARDCKSDGRYAAFLTSAPLNLAGGYGSPANALAIK
jgi:kynurenine formamidase